MPLDGEFAAAGVLWRESFRYRDRGGGGFTPPVVTSCGGARSGSTATGRRKSSGLGRNPRNEEEPSKGSEGGRERAPVGKRSIYPAGATTVFLTLVENFLVRA